MTTGRALDLAVGVLSAKAFISWPPEKTELTAAVAALEALRQEPQERSGDQPGGEA